MAILVEFTVVTDRFELGELLRRHADLSAELERIHPVDDSTVPYLWVAGTPEALDDLTASFEASETVESATVLDELPVDEEDDRQYLYRIEWRVGELDVVRGIVESGGVVLDGEGTGDRWTLRLRFADHEDVANFHQFLARNGITDFAVDHVYELRSPTGRDEVDDLSTEQRRALTVAAQRGYFESPRGTTLAEVGDELGISQQAASERLRRGLKHVVFWSLNIPETAGGS